MTISVSVSRSPDSARKMSYPKLIVMHQTGSILYMNDDQTGTVLQTGFKSPYKNGHLIHFPQSLTNRTDWNDFRGTVELKNETNECD